MECAAKCTEPVMASFLLRPHWIGRKQMPGEHKPIMVKIWKLGWQFLKVERGWKVLVGGKGKEGWQWRLVSSCWRNPREALRCGVLLACVCEQTSSNCPLSLPPSFTAGRFPVGRRQRAFLQRLWINILGWATASSKGLRLQTEIFLILACIGVYQGKERKENGQTAALLLTHLS